MAVAALFLLILGYWNVWIERASQWGFELVMYEMRDLGDETVFSPEPKSPYSGSYTMPVFAIIMESCSAVVSNQKDLIIFAASLSLYFVVFKGSFLTATRAFVVEQVSIFYQGLY